MSNILQPMISLINTSSFHTPNHYDKKEGELQRLLDMVVGIGSLAFRHLGSLFLILSVTQTGRFCGKKDKRQKNQKGIVKILLPSQQFTNDRVNFRNG